MNNNNVNKFINGVKEEIEEEKGAVLLSLENIEKKSSLNEKMVENDIRSIDKRILRLKLAISAINRHLYFFEKKEKVLRSRNQEISQERAYFKKELAEFPAVNKEIGDLTEKLKQLEAKESEPYLLSQACTKNPWKLKKTYQAL